MNRYENNWAIYQTDFRYQYRIGTSLVCRHMFLRSKMMFDGFYCLFFLHRSHQVEDPSKDWDKGTDLRWRVLSVWPIAQPDAYRFPGNLRLGSQEQRAPKALKYRPIQPLVFSFSNPCRRPPSPSDLSAFSWKAPWPDRETRWGRLCPLARSEELSQSWPSAALAAARAEWRTASRTVRMCVIHACLLDDFVRLHCCFVLWLYFPDLEQFLLSFRLSPFPHFFFFVAFCLLDKLWRGGFSITSLDIYVLLSYCLEFIFQLYRYTYSPPSLSFLCFLVFSDFSAFQTLCSNGQRSGISTRSWRKRYEFNSFMFTLAQWHDAPSANRSVSCICGLFPEQQK